MASSITRSSTQRSEHLAWIPRFSVMDRYIATELVFPFLFGVGAFSTLGLSVGVLFELIRQVSEEDLPISTVFQVLFFKIPEFVSYAFPMSVLLATLITFSRFSSDSEIVALKGSGISIYRILVPVLFMSFLVTGITFVFNESIVPEANYRATTILDEELGENVLGEERSPFQDENILYWDYSGTENNELRQLFFASEFDGERMYGLQVLNFSQDRLSQIINAQSAAWNANAESWDFFNGTVYLVAEDGSYSTISTFEERQFPISRTPLDIASVQGQDPNEMSLAESWERVRLLQQRGSRTRLRRLLIRIHERYALPFACVVFGLVGAALGSQLQRTGRATSFSISIVAIFSYYLVYSLCSAIAQAEIVTPLWGAWLPNVFGMVIAGILIQRAVR